ncbi:methyltransferase [Luminiphilus sp.]|nr:methyltransferase [Luminiphilus sp.]
MEQDIKTSVQSKQKEMHDDLEGLVQKHLLTSWREPIPEHSRSVSQEILSLLIHHRGPLILDSFCGTGMSTTKIAADHPNALVIGIDKSSSRLAKHLPMPYQNYRLFQATCEHVWAELVQAQVSCQKHYLLYPNPWPKKGHLKRRIHGHPSFPLLKTLGGVIEVRSNWKIYVDEFAKASKLLGLQAETTALSVTDPLTLFERKYALDHQGLWRCTAHTLDH